MLGLGRAVVVLSLLTALWPALASAQPTRAGVVTTLEGTATAARAAAAQPVALKFKDDVFVNDRVVTGDRSIARLLLGGKAVVTIRERSALTITELPDSTTIDLASGKIAVAVAKERMRPGQSLEVRTPNAVAAVRGTVFIVEILGATADASGAQVGVTTNVYNFAGIVNLRLIAGRAGTLPSLRPAALLQAQGFDLPANTYARAAAGALTNLGVMPPDVRAGAVAGTTFSGTPPVDGGQKGASETAMGVTATTLNAGLPDIGGGPPPPPPPTPDQGSSGSCPPPCLQQSEQPQPSPPPPTGFPKVFETNYGPPVPYIAFCDDCVTNVTFGFPFPFLGSSYSSGEISTNGTVSLGGSNGTSYTASVSDFLNGYPRIAAAWGDHDPRYGNGLKFNMLPGRAVFTWDAVAEYPGIGSNTFQLQLRSDGSIVFAYINLNFTSPYHNILTGVTPGGEARDPGSINFAGMVPFRTTQSTVYQFFEPGSTFNLNGQALIFTPNGLLWDVADPGLQVLFDGMRNADGPLFDLKGTSLTSGSRLYLLTNGSQDSLPDSLLRAVDTALTLPGLLLIDTGGQLTVNGSNPLVLLSGGTHTIGTSASPAAIFDLVGRSSRLITDGEPDPVTGGSTGLAFGADRPIQGSGGGAITTTLLQVDNAATVDVPGDTGRVFKIDTALLEATAPLLALSGGSTLTTGGNTVDLIGRARLDLPNDAVAMISLNSSRLTVTNGNLVNVAGGSMLNVAGSLVSLANGSTLNILNGLLLNVSGGSVASIGGSLVSFSGTGNALNVTNAFRPTALINGIPVSGPVDSFRIGANALAGLGTAGIIRINGVPLNPTTPLSSLSGSLVAIQGGGSVKVGP